MKEGYSEIRKLGICYWLTHPHVLLWTVNFSYLLLSKTWYFVDPTVETQKTSGKKWLYDNEPWEGQHVISHKGKPQFQNQLVQSSNNNMSKQTSKYLTKKFPWIVCVCSRTRVCVVQTRGTSPQLHARIGGRAKRRRPNLWPYGWSILVIGLDIKQARTFND